MVILNSAAFLVSFLFWLSLLHHPAYFHSISISPLKLHLQVTCINNLVHTIHCNKIQTSVYTHLFKYIGIFGYLGFTTLSSHYRHFEHLFSSFSNQHTSLQIGGHSSGLFFLMPV